MPEDDALGLVPVLVSAGGAGGDGGDDREGGAIEIEMGGVRLRVAPGFDAGHLARVIAAVRAAS